MPAALGTRGSLRCIKTPRQLPRHGHTDHRSERGNMLLWVLLLKTSLRHPIHEYREGWWRHGARVCCDDWKSLDSGLRVMWGYGNKYESDIDDFARMEAAWLASTARQLIGCVQPPKVVDTHSSLAQEKRSVVIHAFIATKAGHCRVWLCSSTVGGSNSGGDCTMASLHLPSLAAFP